VIGDLVFGFLVGELEDAWALCTGVYGTGATDYTLVLSSWWCRRWVNILIVVPWSERGRENGIPDDGLRRRLRGIL
jgi:hypothetical protein